MFRPSYDSELFYHWHKVQTRFRDLDPLNHTNNAVFNTYFEEARIHFTYSIPELVESLNQGFAFVLVKSTIEYLKPITYPSTLLIGSGIVELGNTSVVAIQAIFEENTKQLHSVAEVKGVWYDSGTKRPAKVPQVHNLDELLVNIDN